MFKIETLITAGTIEKIVSLKNAGTAINKRTSSNLLCIKNKINLG